MKVLLPVLVAAALLAGCGGGSASQEAKSLRSLAAEGALLARHWSGSGAPVPARWPWSRVVRADRGGVLVRDDAG